MLADLPTSVQSGSLDRDVHLPATAKLELMHFIASVIPYWRDHPDRPSKRGETLLTEHLCDYLNGAAHESLDWTHVQFRAEAGDEIQGGRKIDMAIKPLGRSIFIEGRRHSQFQTLFPIECKRLPTPNESGRDHREYVITDPGTTGGLQRFKFGFHGAAHNFCAMIAYVQEGDFSQWLDEVNGWIKKLAEIDDSPWRNDEVLNIETENTNERTCILSSFHPRLKNLPQLQMMHLWILMEAA